MSRLLIAMLMLCGAVQAGKRPVILTTDCGCEIDDQWALAYLLLSPRVEMKGIVTTHAPNLKPPASQTSAECARQIAHQFLKSPVPVLAGSPLPLPGPKTPLMNDGVRFILDTSRAYSPQNRLAVLAIGAATDVASALLADPALADRIEIVSMAFDDWPNGGDPWNVKNDPAAYQVIFDSNTPLTVGTTAVTRRHLRLDLARARQVTADGGPLGDFLYGLFAKFVRENTALVSREAGPNQWVLWDVVAPAYLLGMTQSREVPRPSLNADLSFSHPETNRRIGWITSIDSQRVWSDFSQKLRASQSKR